MGNLSNKKIDPDTAWKAQNREQKENLLYRYVNLQKGGEIIKVYERDGPAGLEKFLRREVEPLLYREGQGDKLSKADWIRFQAKSIERLKLWDGFRVNTDRKGAMLDEIERKEDQRIIMDYGHIETPYFQHYEHEACWRLDCRGAMGETALHLLTLHGSPTSSEIAKIMLKLYPKLARDIYEGDEYYGETALHLAIVYGDFDLVKALVQSGADVNQRATGRFFLPEDQKKSKKKATNYDGYAYYGEYALAFAACFGHEEIYDYLIDHGADPNAKDSFGNTVLHMLVINNQINMFSYAVKHHSKKALMDEQNNASLTALTLSSKLGRHAIFKEIIELQSFEIWRYSNITCSCYPLAPLDTIGSGGKTNWSSTLIYITDGATDEHLEMLEGGVIKQLLDEKWKSFAQRRFFERFAMTVLYLIILSAAVYLRPTDTLHKKTDTESIIQAPAKAIFNISCVLLILCVPMRLLGLEGAEVVMVSFACPMSWAFLLFFLRGSGTLGPFVVMIYKMMASDMFRFVIIFMIFMIQFTQVTGPFVTIFYRMIKYDLRQFVIIYLIFLCGNFTPTFYFLFKDLDDDNISSYKDPLLTLFQLFQMTLGEFKYIDLGQSRQPALTKMVFFIFAILTPILLLNMLIAMMGNTYQQVISRSEKEWKRQKAKIIIVLERSYSRKQLLRFQEEYSVKLIGSDSDERGLMVIKTSKKTKARKRKGAISNWKRLIKEVKTLLKEAKKQGKKLDLHSKNAQAGIPIVTPRAPIQHLLDDDPEDTADLLSAMTQLAWEKDIDLSRVPALPEDKLAEAADEVEKGHAKSAKARKTPAAANNTNNNNEQRPSSGNGTGRPKRSAKVSPNGAPTPTGNRVPSARSRKGLGKKSQSSGEKDDKVFTISGNHSQSSNSMSSLLGNAWETNTEDTNV